MSRKKRGITIASIMLLAAVLISACQQPYSTPPAVTNTPLGNSFFSTPMGEPDSMEDVQNFITQTALAAQGGIIPTGTPGTSTDGVPTVTSTSIIVIPPTSTQAISSGVTQTAPTAPPSSSGTWTLRMEEFPFCIARRYNVDPNDLLKASGLTSPDIYYEGLRLVIPQNSTWNEANLGSRGLRTRPGTYTVTGNADTTVYGVACKYGDVDPASIAQNNGISIDATLSVGQSLNIP